MLTIGLDVHQSKTSVCVLDARGNIFRQAEVKGDYAAVADYLGALKKPFQVCYEASTGYGALYDRLAPLTSRIHVGHPNHLAAIFNCKRKHNKIDAKKLATLLHLSQVPTVHVPSQEVRSWRGLIEHRRSLVDKRVGIKNQIRALLRNQGLKGLPGKRQWTPKGIQWLRAAPWPTDIEKFRLEILLEVLQEFENKIDRVTAALDQIADKHAGVQLLRTIDGIGPRTAEAFVAYIDDPHRFRSGTIGAYLGLVPCEDSTGDKRRLGHLTREGPATVRKLLTEAVWRAIAINPHIKAIYERICRGDKSRRKIALVATCHWLCRVMLAMLKTGEEFRAKPAS